MWPTKSKNEPKSKGDAATVIDAVQARLVQEILVLTTRKRIQEEVLRLRQEEAIRIRDEAEQHYQQELRRVREEAVQYAERQAEQREAQSVLQTTRVLILRQARVRLGEAPIEMLEKIYAITNVDRLKELGMRLLEVNSWQDMGLD